MLYLLFMNVLWMHYESALNVQRMDYEYVMSVQLNPLMHYQIFYRIHIQA